MSRVTRKEWYRRVNSTWPAEVPPLTPEEAERAARRLYRFVRRTTYRGEVLQTTGNRYTTLRRGVLYVNAGRGWKDLVHILSHALARAPFLPHGGEHARLEMRMIREVLRRGWLEGRLRAKAFTPEVVDAEVARLAKLDARIAKREAQCKRLRTKIKGLSTRLKKASRSLSALQRGRE